MAVTLADGSTAHKSSAVDVPFRFFGQSDSLNMLFQCHMLDHLSNDLVLDMDWLYTHNLVIDWIGSTLNLCIDSISITVVGTFLASIHARLFNCVPCLFCYRQCTTVKLQLGLLCCVMSPIVSLADLEAFLVGRGLV